MLKLGWKHFAGHAAVLVFVAVMLLLEGLYLLWRPTRARRRRSSEQRLQSLAAGTTARRRPRLLKARTQRAAGWSGSLLRAAARAHAGRA